METLVVNFFLAFFGIWCLLVVVAIGVALAMFLREAFGREEDEEEE